MPLSHVVKLNAASPGVEKKRVLEWVSLAPSMNIETKGGLLRVRAVLFIKLSAKLGVKNTSSGLLYGLRLFSSWSGIGAATEDVREVFEMSVNKLQPTRGIQSTAEVVVHSHSLTHERVLHESGLVSVDVQAFVPVSLNFNALAFELLSGDNTGLHSFVEYTVIGDASASFKG